MRDALLLVAAALLVLIRLVHSVLGERRLIGPALVERNGIYAHQLARAVTRFAWHLTTACIAVVAALVVLAVVHADEMIVRGTALIVGVVFLGSGVIDAVMTRGRHVGWPALTGVGLLSLASLCF